MTTKTEQIPVHQWTHTGDKVLLLRCCNADGTSYGGYQWPQVGEIARPAEWVADNNCGNGLHGWPWGIAFGDGKDPQYDGLWIVFAASPADVINLGGKCKVREAKILFRGTYQEALSLLLPGYHSYVLQASSGASSATGYSGASSATGDRGASSATGDRGASSATGYRGASSATGYRGASSATGYSGASSATGYRGASSATGDSGASSATGYRGASSATGDRGASSATGDRGASSATGYRGAAIITGEYATIEVGPTCLGCVTSHRWQWRVRAGAYVVCRVNDKPPVTFSAVDYEDGSLVLIEFGEIVDQFNYEREVPE